MPDKNTPLNDERNTTRRTPIVNDMDPDGMDADTEGEEHDDEAESDVDEADSPRDRRKPARRGRTH